MSEFRQFIFLLRKDLLLSFRAKDTLVLVFVFSVLVALIFAFAFGPIFPQDFEERGKLAASVLWTALAFAGIITLNRSFEVERISGGFHGVRLTGVDPGSVYLSKVVSNTIFLAFLEVLLTPITLQFLEALDRISLQTMLKLIGVLSTGTLGFCAVGVVLSGISTSTHGKESLLSVILLPLTVPVIMAGSKCTLSLLTTGELQGGFWISILIFYSLVFLASSYLLFEFVIED